MISPYSLTVPGGVQVQILGLARALRRRGVDVRVLGPCDGPPPEPGVTPLGNSLPTAANGSIAPIAPDIPAQLRVIRAIWEEEFDVVHLHEPLAPGVTTTTILLQAAPMVGTFHAAGTSEAYRWINRGCRALLKRLAVACAVSADAEKMAKDAIGGTYTRVFNGVELVRYQGAKQWRTEGPTIFFVGRHEERKGLEQLLQAMAGLPAETQLWIAGVGPETERLQREFGSDRRVHWLGRIDDEEKVQRLRGADVFCAPSLRGESFGVVLLEAMAAETPIVASDLPGYANVARDGVHANLVPAGDIGALRDGLHHVLFNNGASSRMLSAGLDRVQEFSMDRLAERYIEIYRSIAS